MSSGADEGWHDLGTDNDCDGSLDDALDLTLEAADVFIDGPEMAGYTGQSVGFVPDLYGENEGGIWFGAAYDETAGVNAGAIYLVEVASTLEARSVVLDAESPAILAEEPDTYLATGATLQQEDGDVVVVSGAGAQGGAGATWWIEQAAMATLSGPTSVSDVARATVIGADGEFFGTNLVAIGDMDGDGLTDLAVAAYSTDSVYLFSGDTTDTLSSGDFDAIWTTEESGTMPVPTYTGDVDGDGRADLGLTAMVEDRATVGSGVAMGATRLDSGIIADDARYRFVASPVLGRAFEDEVTGSAMLVALEWQASFFPDPSMDGTMDALTDAEYQIFRTEDEGAFIGVEDLGWFGNAGPAVLLRAPDSPPDSRSGDCVVLQSDELAEEALAADLQLSLTGSAAGDDACRASVAADLNQDSDLDLLIGAPGVDGARENAGRVYGLLAP